MAANKVTVTGLVQYHVLDAHNNRLIVAQPAGSANITIGWLGGTPVVLTKTNASDLLTALTNFSNTGLLS